MPNTLQLLAACLDKRERLLCFLVLAVSLASSIIEIGGMATMAPFMAAVMGTGQAPAFLASIHGFVNSYAAMSLPTFLGIIALLGMSASVISNLACQTIQFKVTFVLAKRWGGRMYANLMKEEFEYIQSKHTSEFQILFDTQMTRALQSVLNPAFILFSKGLLLILIAGASLFYNPSLTLIIVLFYLSIGSGLYKMGRRTLEATGQLVTRKTIDREKFVLESLTQLKLIKLWNKSQLFTKFFSQHNDLLQDSSYKTMTWAFIPRYALEIASYATMVVVSLLILNSSTSKEQVISIISLFALAAYRAMPAVQALITNSSLIRSNIDALTLVSPFLKERPTTEIKTEKIDPNWGSINFENVSFKYPNAIQDSLSEANIAFNKTGFYAVIGRSGAGKSTLLNLLLGFIKPTLGHIKIGKQSLTHDSLASWQSCLGYVPQDIILFDESLQFNICMGEPNDQDTTAKIKHCLKQVHLPQFEAFLDGNKAFNMGEGGRNVSGGQRQRLGLARALYRENQIIILDEITSNLDIITESNIISTVKEIAKTKCVIWVTHSQRVAEVADEIVLLQNGKVEYQGAYAELITKKTNFKSIFQEA